jgi:hypothetical protein
VSENARPVEQEPNWRSGARSPPPYSVLRGVSGDGNEATKFAHPITQDSVKQRASRRGAVAQSRGCRWLFAHDIESSGPEEGGNSTRSDQVRDANSDKVVSRRIHQRFDATRHRLISVVDHPLHDFRN